MKAAGDTASGTGAPATSRLRRVLGPFYFTGVFWYRLHLLAARILPEPLKRVLVAGFAGAFFCALPGVRRAVGHNLQIVLGPAGWWRRQRRAWRVVHGFSWCLTERYEQFVPGVAIESRVENRAAWDRLVAREQGFVLVTAHMGGWEMGSTLPATAADTDLHLVREPELDERSQAFVEELLAGLGGPRYHTHFARGELELGLELLDALRGGGIVALQGDRPRSGGDVIPGQVFGHPYSFPRGVPMLARLAEVPLLPVFVLREGRRRYRVVFREPIQVPRTADRDADCRAATERIAAELEWALREAPTQWFRFGRVGDG